MHVWMYTENTHGRERWPLWDAVIGELRLGLMFFFVVSGFLLARPWVRAALDRGPRPTLARFVRQRTARVMPAYLAALAGAFAILYGTGHPREVGWGSLPIFAIFLQNQVGATAGELNPPTWSLAVEVGFYLLLPILGWTFLRARTRGRMLAICGVATAVGLAWCGIGWLAEWPDTTMTSPLTFLPVFVGGIAACVVSYDRLTGRRIAVALLVLGWSAVAVNGWWHAMGDTGLLGHTLRDAPAAAGFAAIIVALCARPPGVLDLAPIRSLGVISYGLYLWHIPVLYWLKTRGLFPESFGPAYVAVLAPSIALGTASWLAIERPFVRVSSRSRRSTVAGPPPRSFPGLARDAP